MRLANSVLGSSEINITFHTLAFHLSLKNTIVCANAVFYLYGPFAAKSDSVQQS